MCHFGKTKTDETLRPYQLEAKQEIYKLWKNNRSVMLQMPTGTGKTRVFTSIIKDIHNESARIKKAIKVLVLVHRRELIEQVSETLGLKYNIAHGIILSRFFEQKKIPTQIASVQTLIRRLSKWKEKQFDYIIIDEAHHALAQTYKKIIKEFKSAKILGVTATPYRLNGAPFTSIFQKLVTSHSILEFINDGYLCNYKYYSIPPNSLLNLEIESIDQLDIGGDYSEKAMLDILNTKTVLADIMGAYRQFAAGKKGIVYTINKRHNNQITQLYKSHGIPVEAIDSDTSDEKRNKIIADFKRGELQVLCNVNIFSEGFDCPDIEFIQLARPTKSLSLYLQQIGRGLRPHDDLQHVVFLDNVGSYNQFGLPSYPHDWLSYFEGNQPSQEYSRTSLPVGSELSTIDTEIEHGTEEVELLDETEQFGSARWDEVFDFPVIKVDYDSLPLFSLLGQFEYKIIREQILEDLELVESFANKEISEIPFESIEQSYEDLTALDSFKLVRKGDLYGIVSERNELVLPVKFEEIQLPNGFGHSLFKKNGKYGIIDILNKTEVVPNSFDSVEPIYEMTYYQNCIVSNDSKEGVYNLCGKMMLEIEYDEILFQKNFYNAYKDSNWQVFDEEFNLVEEFDSYNEVSSSSRYVVVKYKDYVGLWDTNLGHLVLPIFFKSLQFKNGFIIASIKGAILWKKEYFLLLNHSLDTLIPPRYTKMSFFDNNKLLVYGHSKTDSGESQYGFGIVDANGNILIGTKYETILTYKDKLLVRKDPHWMVIDWNETVITKANKKIQAQEQYENKSKIKLPKLRGESNVNLPEEKNKYEKHYRPKDMYVGQRIDHRDFGLGTIIKFHRSKLGGDLFEVDFDNRGPKKLLVGFSPLKLL